MVIKMMKQYSQNYQKLDRMLNATLPPNNAFKYDAINQLKGNIDDIYFVERRIENTLSKINCINDGNKKLLLRFYDFCRADGLSKIRIERLLRIMLDVWKMVGKNLDELDKDNMIRLLGDIEDKDWSFWTKYTYKVVIKKFYKWLGRGCLIDWIKLRHSRKRLLPEEILTEEEVKRMIDANDNIKYKTMIAIEYEGGFRPGEFFTLRIKSVTFDEHGAVLIVNGKMGMRRVRIVRNAGLLRKWVFMHPLRDNPESPLWISYDWKSIM